MGRILAVFFRSLRFLLNLSLSLYDAAFRRNPPKRRICHQNPKPTVHFPKFPLRFVQLLGIGLLLLLAGCSGTSNSNDNANANNEAANTTKADTSGSLASLPDSSQEDTLVVDQDSTPKFKAFAQHFVNARPQGLVFKPGTYRYAPDQARQISSHPSINKRYVAHFLGLDTNKTYHYVMNMRPDTTSRSGKADSLKRLIFADSLNFYVALFEPNGKKLAQRQITAAGEGKPFRQQLAYYYPHRSELEIRTKSLQGPAFHEIRLCRLGSPQGLSCSQYEQNPSFSKLKARFEQRRKPLAIDPTANEAHSIWAAVRHRLNPNFVLKFLDKTYEPSFVANSFEYTYSFEPFAQVSFGNGITGLVVKEVEYRKPSVRNTYMLYTFNNDGERRDKRKIAYIDVTSSDESLTQRSVIESCVIQPDNTIKITRSTSRENLQAEESQQGDKIRLLEVTGSGEIVEQQLTSEAG
jgi:hypothetical protein